MDDSGAFRGSGRKLLRLLKIPSSSRSSESTCEEWYSERTLFFSSLVESRSRKEEADSFTFCWRRSTITESNFISESTLDASSKAFVVAASAIFELSSSSSSSSSSFSSLKLLRRL